MAALTSLCSVLQIEQIQAESVSMTTTQPSPFASPQKGDAPSSPDTDWQHQVDSVDIDEEGMREVYIAALEECKYDSASLEAVHTLAEKAQQTLNPRFVSLSPSPAPPSLSLSSLPASSSLPFSSLPSYPSSLLPFLTPSLPPS